MNFSGLAIALISALPQSTASNQEEPGLTGAVKILNEAPVLREFIGQQWMEAPPLQIDGAARDATLEQYLADPTPARSRAAVEQYGVLLLPALVERWRGRDDTARKLLDEIGDEAVAPLILVLGMGSEEDRAIAARWLADSDDLAAAAAIKGALEHHAGESQPPYLREAWARVVERSSELAGVSAEDLNMRVIREHEVLAPLHVANEGATPVLWSWDEGLHPRPVPRLEFLLERPIAAARRFGYVDAGPRAHEAMLRYGEAETALSVLFPGDSGPVRMPAGELSMAGEEVPAVFVNDEPITDETHAVDSEESLPAGDDERVEESTSGVPRDKIEVFYATNREPERMRGWLQGRALRLALWMAIGPSSWLFITLVMRILRDRFRFHARLVRGGALIAASFFFVNEAHVFALDAQRMHRLGFDYGNRRGVFDRGKREYCHIGRAEVSIPLNRRTGTSKQIAEAAGGVDAPSLAAWEWREDPEKHFVLLTLKPSGEKASSRPATPRQRASFFRRLAATARVEETGEQEVFVYVHGYNVSFDEAARRTAQIAVDIEFAGAPVFFSWPSRGGLSQYMQDESAVEWSIGHLKRFLAEMRREMPNARIHLLAHSMGSRALTAALRRLGSRITTRIEKDLGDYGEESGSPLSDSIVQSLCAIGMAPFEEVVLAAPDIDAATFEQDILPSLDKTARRFTLYASSRDVALEASKRVHGYARAGESNPLVRHHAMDTVYVTAKYEDLLGHSYYGEVFAVLKDIRALFEEGGEPLERGLSASRETSEEERPVWELAGDDQRKPLRRVVVYRAIFYALLVVTLVWWGRREWKGVSV